MSNSSPYAIRPDILDSSMHSHYCRRNKASITTVDLIIADSIDDFMEHVFRVDLLAV